MARRLLYDRLICPGTVQLPGRRIVFAQIEADHAAAAGQDDAAYGLRVETTQKRVINGVGADRRKCCC